MANKQHQRKLPKSLPELVGSEPKSKLPPIAEDTKLIFSTSGHLDHYFIMSKADIDRSIKVCGAKVTTQGHTDLERRVIGEGRYDKQVDSTTDDETPEKNAGQNVGQ